MEMDGHEHMWPEQLTSFQVARVFIKILDRSPAGQFLFGFNNGHKYC